MAHKYIWTPEKIADEVKALRVYVDGFEAADGFNLRSIKSGKIGKGKRAKFMRWYHRIQTLQGQSTQAKQFDTEEELRRAQDAFHGQARWKDLRVAFIPTPTPKRGLQPRDKQPKVKFVKLGAWVQEKGFKRAMVPFNRKRMAVDPREEIKRAAAEMGGAPLYFIQNEMYQTLAGRSLPQITREILMLMEQYDGIKELPKGSGNEGDAPKHHHWKLWLKGLVGYRPNTTLTPIEIARVIVKGRRANDLLKQAQGRKMRRRGLKGRK